MHLLQGEAAGVLVLGGHRLEGLLRLLNDLRLEGGG
jgi:hypothetical protein